MLDELRKAFGDDWAYYHPQAFHGTAGDLAVSVDVDGGTVCYVTARCDADGHEQSIEVDRSAIVPTIRGMMGAHASYELHSKAREAIMLTARWGDE